MNPWTYKGKPVKTTPKDAIGFVYVITSLIDGRSYIGKKNLTSSRLTRKTKAHKRRKRTITESDWRQYFGSCKELLAEVAHHGPAMFEREILHFHSSKVALSYAETEEQFKRDVLRATLPTGGPAYFNRCILGKYYAGKV